MLLLEDYNQYTVHKKFWEELIRLLSLHKSLFEVPNWMKLNISELTLTSFKSI